MSEIIDMNGDLINPDNEDGSGSESPQNLDELQQEIKDSYSKLRKLLLKQLIKTGSVQYYFEVVNGSKVVNIGRYADEQITQMNVVFIGIETDKIEVKEGLKVAMQRAKDNELNQLADEIDTLLDLGFTAYPATEIIDELSTQPSDESLREELINLLGRDNLQ